MNPFLIAYFVIVGLTYLGYLVILGYQYNGKVDSGETWLAVFFGLMWPILLLAVCFLALAEGPVMLGKFIRSKTNR
jgi:hypothetical protein